MKYIQKTFYRSLKSIIDEAEFIGYDPGEDGRVFPVNLSAKRIESVIGDKDSITDMLISWFVKMIEFLIITFYLIFSNESNGLYIVSIKEAKLFFPDLVIKYYEEKLTF